MRRSIKEKLTAENFLSANDLDDAHQRLVNARNEIIQMSSSLAAARKDFTAELRHVVALQINYMHCNLQPPFVYFLDWLRPFIWAL